jgi:Kef-type K+ transport system membrane component KefB
VACLGLIVLATVGKLGGSMFAARVAGMGWNEAFKLGALMNTRGLVELIVLNIGLDLGILSPRVFAMMVLDGAGHDVHDRPRCCLWPKHFESPRTY